MRNEASGSPGQRKVAQAQTSLPCFSVEQGDKQTPELLLPIKTPGYRDNAQCPTEVGLDTPGGLDPGGAATSATSATSAAPPPPPPTSTSTLTIAPTTEAVWIVTHGVGHPSTVCTWHVHKRTVGGSPNYSSHPHFGAVRLVMERGLLPE